MVKIDDPEEALEYGLKTLPALVFFEHKMPNIYEGNLLEAHKVSSWITDIAMEDKIEFVTPAMLDKLLDDYMNIAVFIHDRQVWDTLLENLKLCPKIHFFFLKK